MVMSHEGIESCSFAAFKKEKKKETLIPITNQHYFKETNQRNSSEDQKTKTMHEQWQAFQKG